jgi:hypothetical protein
MMYRPDEKTHSTVVT